MKKSLSIIAGIVTGFIVIMITEAVTHKIYPLPKGFDLSKADDETMKFIMEMLPRGAYLMILLGFALGSFSGGLVSSLLSQKIQQPLIVGLAIMLGGIVNCFMIPHPLWLVITSLFMYVPFAFVGGKIGIRIRKGASDATFNDRI